MKPYFLYDIIDIDVFHEVYLFQSLLFDYKTHQWNPNDNHMFAYANYMHQIHTENMNIHIANQNDCADNGLKNKTVTNMKEEKTRLAYY